MRPILLYDTTLRDGAQGEGINFSVEEKLKIAQKLDEFGVHYIEGGWPGANLKDTEFFKLAKELDFKNARLTAFGSTRKKGVSCGQDQSLKALVDAGTPAVAIFGKSWDLHVKEILRTSLEENLRMIYESVDFLKTNNKEVVYDAEHFFDGYKENPEYALKTLKAAINAKADFLVLCDTNGGTMAHDIQAIVYNLRKVIRFIDPRIGIGIHAHNDCGLAVANSLIAVDCGAVMVQGTINGYGERCGNADLISVIPNLQLKMGFQCLKNNKLKDLSRISRYVSEMANKTPFNNRPFVGKSAFAHKGGIHVDAIRKNPKAYEHINPELVGNECRILNSELGGRSNIEYFADKHKIKLEGNGYDSSAISQKIKSMESRGYQFEAAEGSLKILVEQLTGVFKPLFNLESFRVYIEKDKNEPCLSHAMIKVSVGNEEEITAAEGHGPVDALNNALCKAIGKFYRLDGMRLSNFKVRIVENGASKGTASLVRVLIESRDHNEIWSTIGVSEDIIEASWQALSDSVHYKLSLNVDSL